MSLNSRAVANFLNAIHGYETGQVSCSALHEAWRPLSAFYDFQHFMSDEDIRERDGTYRNMQFIELRLFAQLLKAGNFSEAEQVTFLGHASRERGLL